MSSLAALKASLALPGDVQGAMRARGAMWSRIGTRFLPFADAASHDLPLGRLLRLSLFQVSVGMAAVLLTGTLNRVMIVELGMAASLVAAMVSLPLLFAPLRALIGFKSDNHRSILGWRRVPYIWFGTLLQFGGLALLPFALLVMTGTGEGSALVGQVGAGLGFLLVGAGMHTTQTAGLALATDLATEETRPRVVALLYVMLLVGMMISAVLIGGALADFSPTKLVQVVQTAALATMVLNLVALWKQEPRRRAAPSRSEPTAQFGPQWRAFIARPRTLRLLAAVGLGGAGFSMQDVLLEPYGGQVLGLSVGATTSLTALWATGMLAGFAWSARRLASGADPHRLSGFGGVIGIAALLCVMFAGPLQAAILLRIGVIFIGLGAGLFSVGTLTAAMTISDASGSGLALGAWGAVQATAAGLAILLGALARDAVSSAAADGRFGDTLVSPATGFVAVYGAEILLLLAMLVVLGPLVRGYVKPTSRFGLSELPI